MSRRVNIRQWHSNLSKEKMGIKFLYHYYIEKKNPYLCSILQYLGRNLNILELKTAEILIIFHYLWRALSFLLGIEDPHRFFWVTLSEDLIISCSEWFQNTGVEKSITIKAGEYVSYYIFSYCIILFPHSNHSFPVPFLPVSSMLKLTIL